MITFCYFELRKVCPGKSDRVSIYQWLCKAGAKESDALVAGYWKMANLFAYA